MLARCAGRQYEPALLEAGSDLGISIGGNRPNANYFLVDGVTNTDPTFNTQNISLSPDAVQEFQVQTGSYTADMGGAGGGQINIVTRVRHGTVHGTLYEFLRNSAWTPARSMKCPAPIIWCKTISELHWAARSPGKKTFFFLNYEGLQMTEAMTQD